MTETVLLPLAGGALIGLASSALLLLSGRIAGISGIVGGLVDKVRHPQSWRVMFVLGLLVGGLIVGFAYPTAIPASVVNAKSVGILVAAGLLVGFGTRLGSGCTSGHGVCGIGRASPRSLLATVTFIAFGVGTVALARLLGLYS